MLLDLKAGRLCAVVVHGNHDVLGLFHAEDSHDNRASICKRIFNLDPPDKLATEFDGKPVPYVFHVVTIPGCYTFVHKRFITKS